MTANPPSEHYASCSAAPGMPSEEDLSLILCEELWTEHGENRGIPEAAARILSLIRPAFEAKDAEIAFEREVCKQRGIMIREEAARADALQAKLAQAVEAGFREGWMTGEHEGRAYGFTGKLSDNPDRAWNKSKSKRLLSLRSASAAARGETPALASGKEKP